LKFLQIFEILF